MINKQRSLPQSIGGMPSEDKRGKIAPMQLTTDRLILREFVEDDWPAVLAYQRDPRYLRYTHWIDRSPQDVKQFVQMFLSQQFALPRTKFQLAVTLKDTQRLIGNCGIRLLFFFFFFFFLN